MRSLETCTTQGRMVRLVGSLAHNKRFVSSSFAAVNKAGGSKLTEMGEAKVEEMATVKAAVWLAVGLVVLWGLVRASELWATAKAPNLAEL